MYVESKPNSPTGKLHAFYFKDEVSDDNSVPPPPRLPLPLPLKDETSVVEGLGLGLSLEASVRGC